MRTKGHFRNLTLNHTYKSAIASHSWNTGHKINRKNELIIWENIFIHKHAHYIMNFEVPPESSLIKKYIMQTTRQRIDGTNQHRHNACMMQHFRQFELRMDETLPETIVFRQANYLSWRLLINENYDIIYLLS